MIEKLKNNRIDIVLLLLMVICSFLFGIIGVVFSILLLILYYLCAKKHYFIQKLIIFFYFVGVIFALVGLSLINNMENTGIDGIGEALIYGAMVKISGIMILICPIILLIIDNWKYIFTRKTIKIFLIVGIGILLYFPIHNLITTTKVSDNIPSVVNFEDELKQRGFAPYKANYRLYGISSKNKKAIKLSFDENKNEKYPLYVYSVINYPWLIYYANGEIYAVSGKYWDYYTSYNRISGYNEEKIMWTYGINNDVITETEKISVYDVKLNRYKKGNTIAPSRFNYYSKNQDVEDSVFVDIPSIQSWGSEIKQIDRVDFNSLNKLK